MRPKLFLDTNILLDALLKDRLCNEASLRVLDMGKSHVVELAVTTQSLIDVYYIALRLKVRRLEIDRLVGWLCGHVNVETIDAMELKDALGGDDPEDEAQYIHALSSGCDIFVTGDQELLKRHADYQIRIMSPAQFLESCS